MNIVVNVQSNWVEMLPAILAALQSPTSSAPVQAMKNDLERMAVAADNWNAIVGKVCRNDARLNSAEVPPSGEDYNAIVDVVLDMGLVGDRRSVPAVVVEPQWPGLTIDIPDADGPYGKGLRDGLESIRLALFHHGVDVAIIRDACFTVTEAYGNNVDLEDQGVSQGEPEVWTAEDSAAAIAQGWDVFQVDRKEWSLEIQRNDEGPLESDDVAIALVVEKAMERSELHEKALRVTLASRQGDLVRPVSSAIVQDPHHGGVCQWKWEGGQLFHRHLNGSAKGGGKWAKCKKIGATPARIRAVAAALPQAEVAPPSTENSLSVSVMATFAAAFKRIAGQDCPQLLINPLEMEREDLLSGLARTLGKAFSEYGVEGPWDSSAAAPFCQWVELAYPELREALHEVTFSFP